MVIPVIYSLVDGGKEGFRKRFMRGDADEQPSGVEAPPPAAAPAQG
jgi:hypothetical protein